MSTEIFSANNIKMNLRQQIVKKKYLRLLERFI
jgi:hypothetical protein